MLWLTQRLTILEPSVLCLVVSFYSKKPKRVQFIYLFLFILQAIPHLFLFSFSISQLQSNQCYITTICLLIQAVVKRELTEKHKWALFCIWKLVWLGIIGWRQKAHLNNFLLFLWPNNGDTNFVNVFVLKNLPSPSPSLYSTFWKHKGETSSIRVSTINREMT